MQQSIQAITLPMPFRMGTVNCYLIEDSGAHFLIDTGGSNARELLVEHLKRAGCTSASLKLVILTHGDFDHIGNAAFLRTTFETRLAMHPADREMAERGDMFAGRKRPNLLARTLLPLLSRLDPSQRFTPDVLLRDGHDLSEFGLHAQVIHIPGHSSGSIGILADSRILLCGDLFENTKGARLNAIMDDRIAAASSAAKLQGFDISTAYPGHGLPFAMESLAGTNGIDAPA